LFIFVVAIGGCTSDRAQIPYPTGELITVGAVLSLTGSLAPQGQMVKEGYLFCQEWINNKGGLYINRVGRRFEVRMEDDAGKLSQAAEVFDRFITKDGVKLFLGPSSNAITARLAALAESRQVVMVNSNGPSDSIFNKGYRFTFGVLAPASRQMRGVIDMALVQEPKPQKVALLYANDPLSTEIAAATRDYATAKGLNVVSFERYPSGTNQMRAQLTRIAAANPDLVLQVGHDSESILGVKQAKEVNLQARLFAFSDGLANSSFITDLQKDAEYAVGTTQWSPSARTPVSYSLTSAAYASQYLNRFGHRPDQHSAAATAACLALEVAIEKAGSTDPIKVRDTLAALDLKTFFGEIRFDDRGTNLTKPVYVEQVQSGKLVVVWPTEVASGSLRYPAPTWDKRN
jgi:branched-chain amino acid transport system substrate-binding protein